MISIYNLDQVYKEFLDKARPTIIDNWQGTDIDAITLFRVDNYDFSIPILNIDDLGADQPWSDVHFNERVSGEPVNPGNSYKLWPYHNFDSTNDPYLHGGKKFSHTYMERYWATSNLGYLVEILNDNYKTRQAYLPVWFERDNEMAFRGKRVPCTLGYLFWVDEQKFLHCNYYIRSCDLFRHFRNDVYLTMRLVQWIANEINEARLIPGTLNMYIANLHLFSTDIYAVKKRDKIDLFKLMQDGPDTD